MILLAEIRKEKSGKISSVLKDKGNRVNLNNIRNLLTKVSECVHSMSVISLQICGSELHMTLLYLKTFVYLPVS